MRCPICIGKGTIRDPKKSIRKKRLIEVKERAAKILRQKGYKIREIQEVLGYASPRSVVSLLNKS